MSNTVNSKNGIVILFFKRQAYTGLIAN